MLKAYKYRLYPKPHQAQLIDKTIGVCRLVYNLALDVKIRAYKDAGVKLSAYKIGNQLPELRAEYPWIAEVSSNALTASINKVDVAFKGFYNGKGYPKFKKKKSGGQYECHNGRRRIDWTNNTLTIEKIKSIPIVLSRKFQGEIRTITISKSPTGKYFASILVKNEESNLVTTATESIGIDLGLTHFAILSNGNKIENPKYYQSVVKRLAVLQRRASRKKRGSKNKKKALLKVALLHERISNQRNDFLHKASASIARDKQTGTICIEDLAVKNMVKNRKLAKSISDAGWSEFVRQITYKAQWNGKSVIKINRFAATSKMCSVCGVVLKNLPLSTRQWRCNDCNTLHDRDINAAVNIKNLGIAGRGAPVELVEVSTQVEPMKQEDFANFKNQSNQ